MTNVEVCNVCMSQLMRCTYAPIWAIWYAESIVSFRAETAAVSNRRGQLLQTGEEQKAVTAGT